MLHSHERGELPTSWLRDCLLLPLILTNADIFLQVDKNIAVKMYIQMGERERKCDSGSFEITVLFNWKTVSKYDISLFF